ncbi:MAG: prepilin-type N-terminal cleavage/methylation domain-containing protein, partial [Actinomycetota bacterium]|nr:prepilin-type N-terminal cleavage/methylation domain-containing protein [Actinomycetota bacterium]
GRSGVVHGGGHPMKRLRTAASDDAADGGFTLVEMLVAASLFMVLNLFTFTAVLANARVTDSARDATDVNQEARLLLNRMSRELREARAVTSASNAGVFGHTTPYATFDPDADSSVTFEVDFNRVNGIEPNAPDPEVITYAYDPDAQQVLLQAGGQTLPVLAAHVTAFSMQFTSRQFALDGTVDGTKDNIVSWEELDADPAGVRGNGNKLLDLELSHVDSVVIEITLFKGQRRQSYRTQVDLRNRPY